MTTWRARAAEVVITPPVGGAMEGYGARKGVSTCRVGAGRPERQNLYWPVAIADH